MCSIRYKPSLEQSPLLTSAMKLLSAFVASVELEKKLLWILFPLIVACTINVDPDGMTVNAIAAADLISSVKSVFRKLSEE